MLDKDEYIPNNCGESIEDVDTLLWNLDRATISYDRRKIESIIRAIGSIDGAGQGSIGSLLCRSNVKRQLASTMHAAIVNHDLKTVMLIHRCGLKVRAMELALFDENGNRSNDRMKRLLEILVRNQMTKMPRLRTLRQYQVH